jgi:hypothetical protein
MIKEIPLNALVPHPENTNHMNSNMLKKLRRLMERTGRYEPLTVRPAPLEKEKYQVINGHNRLRVLRALGHRAALCMVWDTDDEQTQLYLATLNRLGGKDIPERRAILIETLLEKLPTDELARLLPDRKNQIEKLQELACIELDDSETNQPEDHSDEPKDFVVLEFTLEQTQADEINLALDLAVHSADSKLSRSHALMEIARSYLNQRKASHKTASKRKAEKK